MSSSNAFAGKWESLPTPLSSFIIDVINSMGYSQMTPVQASTIPLFMKNKDVVVEAVTGSGKTLAFVIPIIERLFRRERRLRRNELGALIISPTRELATQIHSVFEQFLSNVPSEGDEDSETSKHPPPLLLISSDSSPAQDVQKFIETGADIVVGTPGRVEEFLLGKGRDAVNVKELEVLVLDEADRLLDLGFTQSLTRIITCLPKQRRTGLFSATMTDALSELVRVGLRNPVRVVVKVEAKRSGKGKAAGEKVEERRVPATLQNFYITCASSEKTVQLLRLLRSESSQQALSRFIVYFATCACVDYFYRVLPALLPEASFFSLHGHIPPAKRTLALSSFVSHASTPNSPSILLCTDVAARGLDLPDVDCVIQFDPPVDPKQFSHRCGRTARAGKEGRAWVLLTENEEGYVDFMSVRKIPLKKQRSLSPAPSTSTNSDDSESLLLRMRAVVKKDRDLHERGTKAFVSFVQAYSKHEASYIFRKQDLDLIGVAKSFALLRLPKMPELKKANKDDWRDDKVHWVEYGFTDKARESQRLAALSAENQEQIKEKRAEQASKRAQLKQRNDAWSKKVAKKQEKEKKKEKRGKKREWLKSQATSADIEPSEAGAPKRPAEEDADDWDELAREERMMKKVKRGQVDSKDFDIEFGGL